MTVRRLVAGSIVTVLLAVTSLAAACDLSCAFALANSDCHAQGAEARNSTDSGMAMDGMDMAGMDMPGMTNAGGAPAESEISQARVAHPTVGDMGPCERQSCDKSAFVSLKTSRADAPHLHCSAALHQHSFGKIEPPVFRDARDDIASDSLQRLSHGAIPLRV